jgi:tetratricopeptide (TPR) repeat protein
VSGAVTVLAFFLPSLQEQWDRYETRKVIDRYVEIGRTLMAEARYEQAEQAFSKALELSENKRLDIEEERLKARVERVNADPTWATANPEGLEESDFLYLLAFQDPKSHPAERAATLTAYGAFLAGARRGHDARAAGGRPPRPPRQRPT